MPVRPINHIEIPAADIERSREFYTILFGWKLNPISNQGKSMMTMVPVNGISDSEVAVLLTPKLNSEQEITHYIDVPNIEDYIKRVEDLGGEVIVPPTEVPNHGIFCLCLDPDKNVFGLWERQSTPS